MRPPVNPPLVQLELSRKNGLATRHELKRIVYELQVPGQSGISEVRSMTQNDQIQFGR